VVQRPADSNGPCKLLLAGLVGPTGVKARQQVLQRRCVPLTRMGFASSGWLVGPTGVKARQ
jgi:hypothetical protein